MESNGFKYSLGKIYFNWPVQKIYDKSITIYNTAIIKYVYKTTFASGLAPERALKITKKSIKSKTKLTTVNIK